MLSPYNYISLNKYKKYFFIAIFLLLFSLITQHFNNKKFQPKQVQSKFQKIITEKENDFLAFTKDELLIKNWINNSEDNNVTSIYNKPYGVFIYSTDSIYCLLLKNWNNNKYYVNENDIVLNDSCFFVNYENGDFEIIRRVVTINKSTFLVVGVIPIKWNYFIKNKYLPTKFDDFPLLNKYYQVSENVTELPINNCEGNALFYLKQTQVGSMFEYDWVTIILRFCGILVLLFSINSFCKKLIQKLGFNKSFLILTSLIIGLRTISYFLPDLLFYKTKLSLFDPSIYASNFINASLADLFINLCLIFWGLNFYYINKNGERKNSNNVSPILSLLTIVVLTITLKNILKSLIIDSKISFDVSNFFSLNLFSFIAFIIVCLATIIYFKAAVVFLQKLQIQKIALTKQIVILTLGAVLIFFILKSEIDFIDLIIIGWLNIFVILFQKIKFSKLESDENSFAFPLFWILFFSISITSFFNYYIQKLEVEQRKKIAEKIYLQTDAVTENLLNIATTGFSNKFFQKEYHKFTNQIEVDFIKDSLVAENFSGYLRNFETNIYLFDKSCNPIFNNDNSTVDKWNNYIKTSGKSVGLDGLFSINTTNIGKSYIYKKLVLDKNKNLLCQLYILLHPKKIRNKGILPELFLQGQDADFQINYPFALYDSGNIVEQNGNYNFPQFQKYGNAVFTIVNNKKENVLVYQPTNSQSVVVVKTTNFWLDFITLFVYLFFAFLFVTFCLIVFEKLSLIRFKDKSFGKLFKLSIRNQIKSTIIFTSLISFIIIGIVTVFIFINKFKKSSEEKLIKSINYSSIEFESNLFNNYFFNKYQREKSLVKLSDQQGLEYNLFDSKGTIIETTQPYIYNRKLVDQKMNPIAYQKIYINKQNLFQHEEKIGLLPFLSLYKSIRNSDEKIVGCLNIPYLNSEAELNQEISGFIATLMNLNAFIFLIAGGIAFLITQRITKSFAIIKDKMKAVNWQTHNEEIIWEKDDEIGALIKEYNAMVLKLDETAKAFALSQREKAWKEMAKQVAHEIKNPLTPMKLSVQYLKKSIEQGSSNVKEIAKTVTTTLIEQIDQLSIIAGNFSQFANIGIENPERINITEILLNVKNLYTGDDTVQIHFNDAKNDCFVFADRNQIIRLFTNIIKNAVEASTINKNIYINYVPNFKTVLVSVKDNGTGISVELQPKIFTVNFTTKTSGTGLGLAICKGIVENANGKIWFNTNESGSTFFVELPLIN